jgi:DNA-binding transcriptional regulator GbsR (MarR family)
MSQKITMSEEEVAFAEIIGDLVEQWGFNRQLGRVWCLLFLRSKPQSPSDIQEALSISAGSVSSALNELQMWGVVKRLRVSGDRNFYYEPETRIWKSISNVLRAREIRILDEAQAGLSALIESLQQKKDSEKEFQIKRVKQVREAIDTAQQLFNALINGGAFSLPKLNRLFDRFKAL